MACFDLSRYADSRAKILDLFENPWEIKFYPQGMHFSINRVFQVINLVVKPASYTVSSVGTIYTSLLYLTCLHAAHVVLKDDGRLYQRGSKDGILRKLS
jgi:hypothetical protein